MRRGLTELVRGLDRLPLEADADLAPVVAAVRTALGAESFGYFGLGPGGGLLFFEVAGCSNCAVRALRNGEVVEPAQRNRIVARRLEAVWHLAAAFADGARLIGWAGATHARRPRPEQIDDLEGLLPSLRRRVELVREVVRGRQAHALAESSLELIGRPAYVVDDRGRVVHANREAQVALAAGASRVPDPAQHEVTEITARGAPAMKLVVARRRRRTMLDPSRFGLTSRQAQVARRLCAGASNRAIAEALGISERTVEVHLTAIYDRLGVTQRAAAIARLLGAD